jgi:predicted nucleic acid-binding protein
MILVDTSVWVDHFRRSNSRLEALLLDEQVLTHPYVIGELACGNLRKRQKILSLLAALPVAAVADTSEVMNVIERERLYARGLGWVDVNLLAAARLSSCQFWTLDKQLSSAALLVLHPRSI